MKIRFQFRERRWIPREYRHELDWSDWQDVRPADVSVEAGGSVLDVSWVDGMDKVQVRVVLVGDSSPLTAALSLGGVPFVEPEVSS